MKRSASLRVLTALVMATSVAVFSPCESFATPPSNPALTKLAADDQADRSPGPNKIDWDAIEKHDAARRAEVQKLLTAGELRTADDFFHAALIFQHGDSVQDIQLALALATTSARIDPSNQNAQALMAQAWDRIMVKNGKPQWYGTQFVRSKTTGKWVLYPTDPSAVTDAQRQAMGLPTLAEEAAHLAVINK
jgi:hypothetical protein